MEKRRTRRECGTASWRRAGSCLEPSSSSRFLPSRSPISCTGPATEMSRWTFDPLVLASLLLTGALYVRGPTRLWRRGAQRGLRRWHLPTLYQAAVEQDGIHALMHVCFLFSAALFWWALVHGRYGRLGYGIAVLYVFTTGIHSTVLGALLTLAPRPWYAIYRDRAPL